MTNRNIKNQNAYLDSRTTAKRGVEVPQRWVRAIFDSRKTGLVHDGIEGGQ